MKRIVGFIVFVFALGVGTAATSFLVESNIYSTLPQLEVVDIALLNGSSIAKSPAGVKVLFAGIESEGTEPFAKFVIYNGLSRPVSYSAHTSEGPWPTIK